MIMEMPPYAVHPVHVPEMYVSLPVYYTTFLRLLSIIYGASVVFSQKQRENGGSEERGKDHHDDNDREDIFGDHAKSKAHGGKDETHFATRDHTPSDDGLSDFSCDKTGDDFPRECRHGDDKGHEENGRLCEQSEFHLETDH